MRAHSQTGLQGQLHSDSRTCKQLCRRHDSALHLWSMAVELNWKKHSLKNLMTLTWLLKLKIKVTACSKLPMTEEVENWKCEWIFRQKLQATVLSQKCRQELVISSLRQNVLPGLLLFFSFLSWHFSVFKMLSHRKGFSEETTRPVQACAVCGPLSCQGLLCYLLPRTSQSQIHALRCGAWKTSQNYRSPLRWKPTVMTRLNPGLNAGITRHSVREEQGRPSLNFTLPDTVARTTGGPRGVFVEAEQIIMWE